MGPWETHPGPSQPEPRSQLLPRAPPRAPSCSRPRQPDLLHVASPPVTGPLPDQQMSSASLSPFFFSLPHNSLSSGRQELHSRRHESSVLESGEIRPWATHPRRSHSRCATPLAVPLGVCLQRRRKPPPASALGEICNNGVLWCTRRSPWRWKFNSTSPGASGLLELLLPAASRSSCRSPPRAPSTNKQNL